MIKAFAIVVVALSGARVDAQSFCYRPEPPSDLEPPSDDPALRAILNDDYERYLLDVEDYLNCVNDEARTVTAESREVLARWTEYFGDEAGIRSR